MASQRDDGETLSIDIPVVPHISSQLSTIASTAAKNKSSVGSPRKKSASLPTETVEYLKAWMMSPQHIAHPYPTEQEKTKIMADTGIELKQLTNWFVNNRKRYWKPRVEARLQKQAQALAHDHVGVPTPVGGASVLLKTNGQQLLSPRSSRNSSFSSLEDIIVQHQEQQQSKKYANVMSCRKREEQTSISVVAADNVSRFVPSSMGSSRPVSVSEGSSSASESGSESSLDGDDYSIFTTDEIVEGHVVRTETIDIHILKPACTGDKLTVEDVSISPNVRSERISRTFDNCALTYRFPVNASNDRKVLRKHREVEITRMKKHYLKLFLSDSARPKRNRVEDKDDIVSSPRSKYSRRSLQVWRDVCRSAPHVYDDSLPSLEEATQLFGYTDRFIRF